MKFVCFQILFEFGVILSFCIVVMSVFVDVIMFLQIVFLQFFSCLCMLLFFRISCNSFMRFGCELVLSRSILYFGCDLFVLILSVCLIVCNFVVGWVEYDVLFCCLCRVFLIEFLIYFWQILDIKSFVLNLNCIEFFVEFIVVVVLVVRMEFMFWCIQSDLVLLVIFLKVL